MVSAVAKPSLRSVSPACISMIQDTWLCPPRAQIRLSLRLKHGKSKNLIMKLEAGRIYVQGQLRCKTRPCLTWFSCLRFCLKEKPRFREQELRVILSYRVNSRPAWAT